MEHQVIIDQWSELLAMIASARKTTDNSEAHSCMDSLQLLATWHSSTMAEKQAEAEAKKASEK